MLHVFPAFREALFSFAKIGKNIKPETSFMKTADNMQHRQKTGIPAVSITLDRRDAVICLYERLVT